mmetsp:Transcript_1086/g.2001  ORF Transcript_1086/g.2001 Transcript_1086/m.2001 type:complete len:104 (+) Transcript_1086:25-336(+)
MMSAVGQQMMSGYGSFSSRNNVNFVSYINELEEEINETRKELKFCKKEVNILNTERDTMAEMSQTKTEDINKYLTKEIHYLEELIIKATSKQKAENSRFYFQC